VGGGLALIVVGVGLLIVDENAGNTDGRGFQTRNYLDTAPAGAVLGSAGLASVALGAWLLLRSEPGPSGPVVSLAPSGGVIGWAGSF